MLLVTMLSIIFILLDQATKYSVINYLNKDIEIIEDFFYLIYTKNNGAAFSILTGRRIFLIIITLLIIGGLIYYIVKNKICSKIEILAFSLIIGGSFGNLIDRIVRGYVIDFISIKILGYNFPVFNIADSLICIGLFLLLIIQFRKERKNANK